MAAPSAALDETVPGPFPGPGGMIIERIKVTGNTSIVGDTVAYVSKFLRDCKAISTGFSFSQSLSGVTLTITIKLQHAIAGTDIEYVDLIGFP